MNAASQLLLLTVRVGAKVQMFVFRFVCDLYRLASQSALSSRCLLQFPKVKHYHEVETRLSEKITEKVDSHMKFFLQLDKYVGSIKEALLFL